MTWSETLYEEKDKFTYCQHSYGEIVEKEGFEDIEYICEISKDQELPYIFQHFEMFLKNIEPKGNMDKFENFLKEKNIEYKTHIWQKPLLD
jgi:hypothetical protein